MLTEERAIQSDLTARTPSLTLSASGPQLWVRTRHQSVRVTGDLMASVYKLKTPLKLSTFYILLPLIKLKIFLWYWVLTQDLELDR